MGQKRIISREKGFTLVELAVIVGIIGILVFIAVPNMIGWRADRKLEGTARVFYSNLQKAKFTAIREAETVSVLVSVPSGDYTMFIDPNQNYTLDAGEETIVSEITVPDVTVSNISLAGNQTQFDTRGMVAVTGAVEYTNSKGRTITIYLNSLGKLSMQ